MTTAPIYDFVRIIPREKDYLDKKYGSRGEIFFDRAANSLRLYNGDTRGGTELARSDFDNIADATFLAKATAAGVSGGGGSIEVGDTAPTSPDVGTIWFDEDSAKIYVYVGDDTSNQWVQPIAPSPDSLLDLAITDGTNGQILSTDGSANFSFIDNFDGTWSSLTGTPTTIGGYGITDAFDGEFASLTSKPTTLAGYGITDAFDGEFSSLANKPTTLVGYGITDGQYTLVSGSTIKTVNGGTILDSGNISITSPAVPIGNVVFTGYTIDSDDSSALTFTPTIVAQSDVSVENDITVRQDATVTGNLSVKGNFQSTGAGTAEIVSEGAIDLTAGTRVQLTQSPIKLASLTQSQIDALAANDGDMVYNTTTNKIQGRANGVWEDKGP
jgi:hypothetical protein